MNKVCISGRLTSAPIFKTYQNDIQLTTFFIANNEYYGDTEKTGFYKIKAWGRNARIINEFCSTGTKLFITGRLEQYRYQDENDRTVYDVSISLEHFDFGENKKTQAEEKPA
jgi:single-strand DNA-binding protein